MRRVSLLMYVGLAMAMLLAGCGNESITATINGTNTPQLSSSATAAATSASGAPTSTPASHPVATDTPPSNTHHQTSTPTALPMPKYCGLITATTIVSSTGNTITTKPSDPQPLEDCFATAFLICQSVTLAITYIDGVGDKGAYSFSAPDRRGGCQVADVEETDFKVDGSITSATFTCNKLIPFGGTKYILGGCSNNQSIYFP
jgi:hypothetical protein